MCPCYEIITRKLNAFPVALIDIVEWKKNAAVYIISAQIIIIIAFECSIHFSGLTNDCYQEKTTLSTE